nr:type VI secretion system-associated FHA domain protein TagH [Methylomarinum sp. Ch1-1]MDP4520078.1 type VI secretion system-associated FHA domain protein TagH [Methylomarinum sp. Ch1-1]
MKGGAGPFAEPDTSPFAEDDDLLNLSAEAEPSAEMPAESPFAEQMENPFLSEQQDDFSPDYEKHDQFSSLHDSYIAPEPTGEKHANDEIPEDFNFEELFNLEPQSSNNQPAAPAIEPQQQDNALLDQQAPPIADESLRPAEPELVKPSPAPSVSGAAEGAAPNLYQAFLAGAGLDQADIRPAQQDDKMRRIGSMFRQFVESTVAVLRSRAEFKSLFRVTVTTIKKADNNPLKFSVTTDEALQHLLNDGKGGFMDSVDAIDEGFQDMLNHQMAMQAGIQASLSEILRQFEPDRIEKQYEEGLVLNKKAKCWEKYCDVYAQLAEQAVEDFYGDAFAEAYEQQMKQIRAVNPKK